MADIAYWFKFSLGFFWCFYVFFLTGQFVYFAFKKSVFGIASLVYYEFSVPVQVIALLAATSHLGMHPIT